MGERRKEEQRQRGKKKVRVRGSCMHWLTPQWLSQSEAGPAGAGLCNTNQYPYSSIRCATLPASCYATGTKAQAVLSLMEARMDYLCLGVSCRVSSTSTTNLERLGKFGKKSNLKSIDDVCPF